MVNYKDIDLTAKDKFRRTDVPASAAAPAAGSGTSRAASSLVKKSLRAGMRSLGSLTRSLVAKPLKSDVDIYFQVRRVQWRYHMPAHRTSPRERIIASHRCVPGPDGAGGGAERRIQEPRQD